jgi:hypothetical protein
MKEDDISELARRVSNLFPQVKDAAVSASIASAFVCAVLSAPRPSLEPLLAGKLEIYPPSMTMFFWLLLAPAALVSVFMKLVSPRLRKQAEFNNAVDTVEDLMKRGALSKAEQRGVWRGIVAELAKKTARDVSPPSGKELAQLAQHEIDELRHGS